MKDLNKITLKISASIKEAMINLNNSGKRIIIVNAPDGSFVGIITDGDLRRALVSGASLSDSVQTIVNTTPIVIHPSTDEDNIAQLFIKHDVLSLPIIDNNKAVGLASRDITAKSKQRDNIVVIMAGGFGTRLRPLTDNCPKPMLRVNNLPLLHHIINSFKVQGFRNFIVSLHYLPEVVTDYFGDGSRFDINISYVYEERPLGTGGALSLIQRELFRNRPFIVTNGDIYTTLQFGQMIDYFDEYKPSAVIGVRSYYHSVPYGVVNEHMGVITSMEEKPTLHLNTNAGIYVLAPSILSYFKGQETIGLPTLIDRALKNGDDIRSYPILEYWTDIGRHDEWNRFEKEFSHIMPNLKSETI